jgi:hypothetical protein
VIRAGDRRVVEHLRVAEEQAVVHVRRIPADYRDVLGLKAQLVQVGSPVRQLHPDRDLTGLCRRAQLQNRAKRGMVRVDKERAAFGSDLNDVAQIWNRRIEQSLDASGLFVAGAHSRITLARSGAGMQGTMSQATIATMVVGEFVDASSLAELGDDATMVVGELVDASSLAELGDCSSKPALAQTAPR